MPQDNDNFIELVRRLKAQADRKFTGKVIVNWDDGKPVDLEKQTKERIEPGKKE